MAYQKLFERGKIGNVNLKNRIVLPPMGTNMAAHSGEPSDEMIRFYEERAKGGCGLIITEITRIDEGAGVGMQNQLSVSSPKYVRKLIQLADAVHKYDSKIFLQLHHPGRQAGRQLLGGLQPVAPSPIPCKLVGEVPHQLTADECQNLVKRFARGAYLAKLAGFDGVELHAAHGYLINQFLSPYSNHRTDAYGGSFQGRLKFLADIVKAIGQSCGDDFPVCVRLSVDEFVPGGIDLATGIKIAQALEDLGVSALNVSAGIYESGYAIIEPQGLPEGWKKHLAQAVKAAVGIPVIATNNIKYPATAEQYLREEVSDFVALGRAQIADPEWGKKARAGADAKIRKCIGCMHCFRSLGLLHPIECTVNPLVGREIIFNDDTLKKDGAGKTMAVIGGGPGGLQAALVLSKRGYDVTLFEAQEALGGNMLLAIKPPHKELLAELLKTQELELEEAGVRVLLKNPATLAKLKELAPQGIIVATGAQPLVPKSIEGIDLPHVFTAEDVLAQDKRPQGKKIVLIGGGVTGLETAELLAPDNSVTVVEMAQEVGTSLYATVRLMLLRRLHQAGVTILTRHKLTAIKEEAVELEKASDGGRIFLEADLVVLAMGVKPDRSFAEQVAAAFDHVTFIGDLVKPRQIADALREANDKASVF